MARGGQPIFQAIEGFSVTPSALPIATARSEVRTLTVTTKSTTAENITITLDGDALATVAVTDQTAGTVNNTATEIAAADYSGIGTGWTALASGADVIFTSLDTLVHTGTYSLSSATTAVGTFAQTTVSQNNVGSATTFSIYVGVTGDLDVTLGATRVLLENVPVGYHPIQASIVHPTTTTATSLIALYN